MKDTLHHKDIFKQHVMPQMMAGKADWDNLSDKEEADAHSFEECQVKCEAQPDCKQFSFDEAGHCKTRVDPRLGKVAMGVKSDWLHDRITQFEKNMAPCGSVGGWQV